MARKISEIKNQITLGFLSNPTIINIYDLEPGRTFEEDFSSVSLESILFDVFSFCIWTLETLFDLHKKETDETILQLKPHTLRWYRNIAKAFQYGHALITDKDIYDNTGLTEEAIAASKIIKYAAVVEARNESRLIVKIATEINGKLQPITTGQYDAFMAYMSDIKDAGISITVTNYQPDRLYLNLTIYYDPLVLDVQGNSIINGGRPVEEALEQYMKELPFNGELVLAHLIDKLQQVPGVAIPHFMSAQTSWVNGTSNNSNYGPLVNIEVKKIPESGYFEIASYANIKYQPNVQTNI